MEVTASEMDRPVESESFNVSESERVNQADCEVFGLGVRNGPSVRIRELFKVSESEGEVLQELGLELHWPTRNVVESETERQAELERVG